MGGLATAITDSYFFVNVLPQILITITIIVMARLPLLGSDDGIWGNILNDFLSVEHGANGTLKIRTDGTLNNVYIKPSSGIPATDLTSSLQSDIATISSRISSTTVTAKGDLLAGI